ncbi:endosome-associated-trafficking regulator 1 [Aulostomus maculatus]
MMSKQRSSKTLVSAAGAEAEELNPFSFREFLRWKNQDPEQEQDQDQDQDQDLDLEQTHWGEEEGDGWRWSFQSGMDSRPSVPTDQEESRLAGHCPFNGSVTEVPRGRFTPENHEGDDERGGGAEMSTHGSVTSCRQSQIQQLQQENESLRKTIRDLQKKSDTNKHRVVELSDELLRRRRREEKEAQDLESMVHSVEKNLALMTKRALKAESSVSRLRAELQQLQMQVESLQLENNRLKSSESDIIMTMKQNAQMASEYLSKTASHAHSSIRLLLDDAETLRLASQLLRCIDKMSELKS